MALAGVIVSLAAILLGSLLGGVLGERWHTKLARRVADPEIGPAADARRRVDEDDAERRDRIERDDAVDRDLGHAGRDATATTTTSTCGTTTTPGTPPPSGERRDDADRGVDVR